MIACPGPRQTAWQATTSAQFWQMEGGGRPSSPLIPGSATGRPNQFHISTADSKENHEIHFVLKYVVLLLWR